ncbi:MAG TPA: YibE/F family protein [Solirubrobacterales bacterium]|nr:YibE/F family protein [Solirubrobacterales bacterium]
MGDERRALLGSRTGRLFAGVAVAIALATAIGVAILWPGDVDTQLSEGLTAPTERAEITSVSYSACPPPQEGTCGEAEIRLESGKEEGTESTLTLGGALLEPELEVGDQIRVVPTPEVPGGVPEELAPQGTGVSEYSFADFERRSPMLWLAIGFAALVIAFGRLRGALSLLGLAGSLAVVLVFIVPAILDGEAPLAVAIIGSLAVMLLTITLAHGIGPKSLAAILGTTASLLLVAVLAEVFTDLTNLTGLASEEPALLQLGGVEVSFEGLLLAGMVIAALGVLDDVTVSQSSTVIALRAASPALAFGELYRRALVVGRDHVSATVNTLVLVYVGASLPVLLIFSSGELGFVDAVNVELVAQEVVAALVGSIGLIAAVPITTALAAALSHDLPAAELAAEAAHAH